MEFKIGDEVIYRSDLRSRIPNGEIGIVIGFRDDDACSVAVSYPGLSGEFVNLDDERWGCKYRELHPELAEPNSSLWCRPGKLIVTDSKERYADLAQDLESMFAQG